MTFLKAATNKVIVTFLIYENDEKYGA